MAFHQDIEATHTKHHNLCFPEHCRLLNADEFTSRDRSHKYIASIDERSAVLVCGGSLSAVDIHILERPTKGEPPGQKTGQGELDTSPAIYYDTCVILSLPPLPPNNISKHNYVIGT
jgi:hypothetical protein